MADVTAQTVFNQPGRATCWAWRDVTSADVCLPLQIPVQSDICVQVKPSRVAGGFGGATVHLQGTLEKDPQAGDYDTLESAGTGAALSFTAADTKQVLQHALALVATLENATGATKVDILIFAVGGAS